MRQLILAVYQKSASISMLFLKVPFGAVNYFSCLFLLELYCSFSTILLVGIVCFFLIYNCNLVPYIELFFTD